MTERENHLITEMRIGNKRIRTGDYLNGKWRTVRKLPVIVGAQQMPEDFEVDINGITHRAKAGDYLLKDGNGKIYPIRKDIFEETYEYLEKQA